MRVPPPIPPPSAAVPPPARSKRAVWFSHPLVIVGVALAGLAILIVGWVVLYALTAADFAPTASQKACVVTADELDDWFSFKVDPSRETWSAKRHFDRAIEIDYTYDDPAPAAPYLNCTLTVEPKLSDAAISYSSIWGGFRIGGNLAAPGSVKLVPADHVFSWGDASRFSFLESGGSNIGFGFIARKGRKIFFITAGGAVLEDPAEVEAFLLPALKRFESESF